MTHQRISPNRFGKMNGIVIASLLSCIIQIDGGRVKESHSPLDVNFDGDRPKKRLNGKKNTMHVNRQSNSIKSPLNININIPCEEMQTSKENRKRERHVLMHAKGMDERTIVYFHTHTHKNTKGKEDPSYHIANMKTVNFTKNTHAA